jgi:hypothetical protein
MRLVQGLDIAALAESNEALHRHIDDLQIALGDVHHALQRTYFLLDTDLQTQSQEFSPASQTVA